MTPAVEVGMGNDRTNRPTVRPLRPDERDAVDAIRCLPPATDHSCGHRLPAPLAATGGTAADALAPPVETGCSWVAALDGRPVGVLVAQPIAFVDDAPLTFWVEEIAVVPEERRRGIATVLYRAFGAWARAMGAQGVLTRVDPDDAAALALHRRVGFQPHGTGTMLWRLGPG